MENRISFIYREVGSGKAKKVFLPNDYPKHQLIETDIKISKANELLRAFHLPYIEVRFDEYIPGEGAVLKIDDETVLTLEAIAINSFKSNFEKIFAISGEYFFNENAQLSWLEKKINISKAIESGRTPILIENSSYEIEHFLSTISGKQKFKHLFKKQPIIFYKNDEGYLFVKKYCEEKKLENKSFHYFIINEKIQDWRKKCIL